MRIEAISMQDGFARGNDKTGKDSSLDAQQLEKTEEQWAKNRRNDIGGEHDAKKNEHIEMQMGNTSSKVLSLLRQEYENSLDFKKDSEAGGAFIDKYVKGDAAVARNAAGIYNVERDGDGTSKILLERSETSQSRTALSEPGIKRLDDTEEEDEPEAISDEDEEEESEKISDNPSNDKKNRWATVNTDRVEAEIRKLNQEKRRIEQALGGISVDDPKRESLQRRFEMIEAELSMKDTDTYRKQNATYSEGV
jgi:hypothetical protein